MIESLGVSGSTMGCFSLNTGAEIPAVGLGTWQSDGASCKLAVKTALEVGYRHLDCAHLYGNESEVGEVLSEALGGGIPALKREDVFVTSKFWCTTDASRRVDMSLNVSLKNLRLSYLDLYLLHWPVVATPGDATDPPVSATSEWKNMARNIGATWRAMESLVQKGRVRAIGVSNFGVSQLQELLSYATIVPAVVQVELHPFWRQDELLKFCQAKGIHVSAHTPLGIPGSKLSSSGNLCALGDDEPTTVPVVFSRSRSVHAPMLGTSIVSTIASRLHKTPAQVILRWGLQRGTSVLPRSLQVDRIKSNFDILDWSLSEADWKSISSIEPQSRLIKSSQSLLLENGPLQSVNEIDDVEANM